MINIDPHSNRGEFFPKFFPEIFYEYVTCGIDPPNYLSKCHIWGGYGGGRGTFEGSPHHATIQGGTYCHVNKTFKKPHLIFGGVKYNPYLCIVSD